MDGSQPWIEDALHERVLMYDAELRRLVAITKAPYNLVQANAANKLIPSAGARFETYQEAERMARAAAEALPDEPGGP
jgi:hypothetical protein